MQRFMHKVKQSKLIPTPRFINFRGQSGNVRSQKVGRILNAVKDRDGLKGTVPHIQYLIGGGEKQEVGALGKGLLNIGDKTLLILQSSHPVRYIVQNEIANLSSIQVFASRENLMYRDWVTIFGRSLLPDDARPQGPTQKEKETFYSKLDSIANAVEAGMFSSDVHQTVVNIPTNIENQLEAELNLGNKYAVLVGDYFAIQVIFLAEQAKSSKVMLAITKGVEEFTSAGVSSKLIDPKAWSWVTPLPGATISNWIEYNKNVSGYFNGGCHAVLTINPFSCSQPINQFVSSSALFLKATREIDDLEMSDNSMTSPFFLTSLPGILYQQLHPTAYDCFRHYPGNNSMLTFELAHIRTEIIKSDVMAQAAELTQTYGHQIKTELSQIASSEFYFSAMTSLVSD